MDEYKRLYELYIDKTDDELLEIMHPQNEYTEVDTQVAKDILENERGVKPPEIVVEPLESESQKVSKRKPVLIIICILCGLIASAILISGFSDLLHFSKPQETSNNQIVNRIYLCNNESKNTLDFSFMAFYNDNTFRGVWNNWKYNKITGVRTDNFVTTYGTYSINENALTINISDQSYSCVIKDDGERIIVGNVEWIDYSDGNYSEDFMKAISQ